MRHYSIKEGNKDKDKWIICQFPNTNPFIDYEFESAEIAGKIADKLSQVYEDGLSDAKEKVMDNLRDLIFKGA